MKKQTLERRMTRIKAGLMALGMFHPGSLSAQYNVCGSPGCQCKHPTRPRRHGPYVQLSYTWRGKSTTRFVRPERVAEMRKQVARYKRFRALIAEWVDVVIALETLDREARKPAP